MRVMTRDQERLLGLLLDLAGSPVILQKALEDLRWERRDPPSLDDIIERILRLRHAGTEQRELALPHS